MWALMGSFKWKWFTTMPWMGEIGVSLADWIEPRVAWGYSGVNGMVDVVGPCWGTRGCSIPQSIRSCLLLKSQSSQIAHLNDLPASKGMQVVTLPPVILRNTQEHLENKSRRQHSNLAIENHQEPLACFSLQFLLSLGFRKCHKLSRLINQTGFVNVILLQNNAIRVVL